MKEPDNFYLQQEESTKGCLLALKEIILKQDENITSAGSLHVFGPVVILGRLKEFYIIKFYSLSGGQIKNAMEFQHQPKALQQ